MTRRGFGASIAGAAASLGVSAYSPGRTHGAEPAPEARLDDLKARVPLVLEYLAEGIPGISIATILDGNLVWSAGFGLLRAGGKELVTTETVFEAASLSKPLLAYAILRLRDAGGIDLDRPLLDYMRYADVGADPRAKLVTARHVLSHRTGLPNWRSSNGLIFAFTPNDRYGYSGEAYFWLQRVLEHVTKAPFAQYMREHVLQPLGMLRSSFVLLPEMIANCASAHAARGTPSDGIYLELGRQYLKVAQLWSKPVESWTYEDAVLATRELHPATPDLPSPQNLAPNAASSLLTTAGDYARFMTRCMPRSARDQHDLSESTRREMLTPHSPRIRALSWGFGWALESEAGATSFWHSGANRGFRNVALADVEGRTGIIYMTNSDEGERLRWPIVHGFTGRGEAALL